jgi:hypothetical protein
MTFNNSSYTAVETATAVELYRSGVSILEIAATLNRTTRSVIAKLTYEGVYVAPLKSPSRLKKPELVIQIANHLDLDPIVLESLQKSTHEALSAIYEKVAKLSIE